MRSLLIAVQFLTRVPVRLSAAPSGVEIGRSLLWYPIVGLLMGLLLALCARVAAHSAPALVAAMLLALWVCASGALHLDGLADSADAWIGGRDDRERTLAIMKDPHVGPVAVVIVVVILLLKYGALSACLQGAQAAVLVLPPVLGRTAMLILFVSTPYVRPSGLGSDLAAHLPRRAAIASSGVICIGIVALYQRAGVIAILVALLTLHLLRRAMLRRLEGFTGDCAGAAIEVIEAAAMTALALSQ